jgi:hypothetical protein
MLKLPELRSYDLWRRVVGRKDHGELIWVKIEALFLLEIVMGN